SGVTGTLLAFSTFATGYIARPVGGLVAGHYGDKSGRKPSEIIALLRKAAFTFLIVCLPTARNIGLMAPLLLVMSRLIHGLVVIALLGMAVFTFLIGCLPSAGSIGLMAPVLLVTCRFIQGIACGAQWGGLALLLSESAGPKHRAFSGSFMQVGVPTGALLGNLAFVIVSSAVDEAAFVSWGWRIPFWATALLVPIVMYIQLRVEDSPEFRQLENEVSAAKPKVVQAPLWQA